MVFPPRRALPISAKPHHADADPALHPPNERFLKEVRKALGRDLPLVRVLQFLSGASDLAGHACDGSGTVNPDLETGGFALNATLEYLPANGERHVVAYLLGWRRSEEHTSELQSLRHL